MNRLFIIFLFIGLVVSAHADTFIPLDDTEHRFIYKQIQRSEYLNHSSYDYFKAPFFLPDSLADLSFYRLLQTRSHDKVNLLLSANDRVFLKENSKTKSYERLKAKLFVNPLENLYIFTSLSLDEEKAEDPTYNGKKWRGLAGGIDQSFAAYKTKSLTAFAGRYKSFWGIEKSLVLSAESALNGFGYSLNWRRLTLSYQLAKLSTQDLSLNTNIYENRYFAGHRLDVRLNKNLRVGLFETVIFGGIGRSVEFNYLNPILFFHSDQLNDNTNDNTFLGFDFTYYHKRTKFYGQFLVDDMQIEKKTQGDQEPNEIGFTFGVFQTELFDNTDIELNYTRITNRTYNQAYAKNRYTHDNRSLGYYNTNDFDMISSELTRWINNRTNISFYASYKRQGEGSINAPWTEPWLDIDGEYSEPFPTGVVEKSSTIQIGADSFIYENFFVSAKGGYRSIKNTDNIESETDKSFYFNIYITAYLFSIL